MVIKLSISVVGGIIFLVYCQATWAQGYKSDFYTSDKGSESSISLSDRDIVAGGGAVAGTGGAIISYKKFKGAKEVRGAATRTIMEPTGNLKIMSNDDITRVHQMVVPGDEVHLVFELSEQESRKVRIAELEDDISSKRSSASMYRMQAAAALMPRTETYTDSDGKIQTRTTGPDYGQHMLYNSWADDAEREADDMVHRLAAVRNGAPIELVVRESILDTAKAEIGPDGVRSEMHTLSNRGSKMMKVSRVPREAVVKARALNRAGAVAATASAIAFLAAAEEVIWGYGSEKVREVIETGELPFSNQSTRSYSDGDSGTDFRSIR